MRPHGIMFHHFHGGRHRVSQGSISAAQLYELLHGVGLSRISSAQRWQERACADELRGDELCLTFDDNLRCQMDVALPVLEELKLTAFWFVYSSVFKGNVERLEVYRKYRSERYERMEQFYEDFYRAVDQSEWAEDVAAALERSDAGRHLHQFAFYTEQDRRFRFVRDEALGPSRYDAVMDQLMDDSGFDVSLAAKDLWLNDDDLILLAKAGHVIGLHSNTHPTRLAQLSFHEQGEQYRANLSHLTQVLGRQPMCMSHPCNSYNADTLAILQAMGIRVGFRSNLSGGGGSLLELPREDHVNLLQRRAA